MDGPRWYRFRIRSRGPIVGLLLPTVIGVVSYAALGLSNASWSGAIGLLGAVIAAPLLLVVGAPFGDSSRYLLAIVASGVLWLGVGWLAASRATRNPLATWTDFWRHYLWMAGGIAGGAVLALGMATIALGEALL